MEENQKTTMSNFTKISIAANTLLFGITGVVYLSQGNKVIGFILLAAGLTNILYSLVTIKTKNYFFVVLNFLYAIVALVVCFDQLIGSVNRSVNMGVVWIVIALIYLVTGFILLMAVRKGKGSNDQNGQNG